MKKIKLFKNVSPAVEHSWLSCLHHTAMVAGLGLVASNATIAVLGLGGGPLTNYIANNFRKVGNNKKPFFHHNFRKVGLFYYYLFFHHKLHCFYP